MIAVLFELSPKEGRREDYLEAAAALRPMLEQIEGFVSIERFQSLANPDKLLSLSYWKDEDAVRRWRTFEVHRRAQTRGRDELFVDYRLRVTRVLRDYGMTDRAQAPVDAI
jgi:heme-degrading monooxygenase HmoA